MISVNYSVYLQQPDSLLLARNAIFKAMFEQAADELELQVRSDRDDSYIDIHVDELNTDITTRLLDRLAEVDLLRHITVDVSTEEERNALSKYARNTAINEV
jgi:hypothetical protein